MTPPKMTLEVECPECGDKLEIPNNVRELAQVVNKHCQRTGCDLGELTEAIFDLVQDT